MTRIDKCLYLTDTNTHVLTMMTSGKSTNKQIRISLSLTDFFFSTISKSYREKKRNILTDKSIVPADHTDIQS